jgi:hypothetical protein
VQVVGGVLADECRALMQQFFRERRGAKTEADQGSGSGLPAPGAVGPGD